MFPDIAYLLTRSTSPENNVQYTIRYCRSSGVEAFSRPNDLCDIRSNLSSRVVYLQETKHTEKNERSVCELALSLCRRV